MLAVVKYFANTIHACHPFMPFLNSYSVPVPPLYVKCMCVCVCLSREDRYFVISGLCNKRNFFSCSNTGTTKHHPEMLDFEINASTE